MSNQDNPNDPVPDEPHVSSPDGEPSVDSSTLTLSELNQYLGKDFKDKESALKSLKDTASFVGKRKEDIEASVRASLAAESATKPAVTDPKVLEELSSVKNQLFYSDHPEYKGYADIIAKMGSNPAEVVESAEFKKVFEKGKAADEAEKTKSVVSSNARLGTPQTVMDEAVKTANARGATQEDVALVFARGINEEGASNA